MLCVDLECMSVVHRVLSIHENNTHAYGNMGWAAPFKTTQWMSP